MLTNVEDSRMIFGIDICKPYEAAPTEHVGWLDWHWEGGYYYGAMVDAIFSDVEIVLPD